MNQRLHKGEYLTLTNYKEPLKKIPKSIGYGYYGTISTTLDKDKIQCHICGDLFSHLSCHIWQTHKIKSSEYKEKFDLARKTALVSENERQRLKESTLKWLSALTVEQKKEIRSKCIRNSLKSRNNPRFKIRLETKNKRGTCPDQLLYKIKEVAEKLGHTPSLAEFITETGGQRYKHLIFVTFGSWLNALKMCNLQPKEKISNKRARHYTDEELLEYLSIYAQENRKIPTATDSKRKLIPDYVSYIKRFGSMEKARQLAGVYNYI